MGPKVCFTEKAIKNSKISKAQALIRQKKATECGADRGFGAEAGDDDISQANQDQEYYDNFQDRQDYDGESLASTLPSEDDLSDEEENEDYIDPGNDIVAFQGTHLDNRDFAVYKRVFKWFVGERLRLARKKPDDSNLPLYDGAGTTKGEFAIQLSQLFVNHDIGEAGQAAFLGLLQKTFDFASFPMHVARSDNVISDVRRYAEQSTRLMTISICPGPNSCCAFLGP